MENLKIENKEYLVPSNWGELSKKQFRIISICFGRYNTYSETEQDEMIHSLKILVLKVLIGIKWSDLFKLTFEQVDSIMHLSDFLYQEPDINTFHLRKFRIWFTVYHGPLDRLRFSSFAEFMKADTSFSRLSKDEMNPYKMIAAMYRPKKKFLFIRKMLPSYNGDPRQNFNERILDRRAKRFKKRLKKDKLYQIIYSYWGFRNRNVVVFHNLFKKHEENVERSGADYGWAGTALELSGDKFGDLKSTVSQDWSTIFVEMSRQVDEEQKRQMKLTS